MRTSYQSVLTLAAALIAEVADADPLYHVTDLGTLGGAESDARAINNAGQVTGYADLGNGQSHAYLYSNGHMNDLGTLGGPTSVGMALNASGAVAGYSLTADPNTGSAFWHAFTYQNGIMHDIGTLYGGNSFAWSMNDVGDVIGFATSSNGSTNQAFFCSGGVMQALDPNITDLRGINNRGDYVGDLGPYGQIDARRAFVSLGGSLIDLSGYFPNASSSQATGINDAGQVVGVYDVPNGGRHRFLYQNGMVQDLGISDSNADYGLAISSSGNIVTIGLAGRASSYVRDGDRWLDLTHSLDAASAEWNQFSIVGGYFGGINDAGTVATQGASNGSYYNGYSYPHAILATPVPEPASLLTLGFGALVLLRRKRS